MTDQPTRRADGRKGLCERWATAEAIARRLEDGQSLTEICRDPLMPDRSTVQRWMNAEVEIARLLDGARDRARESGVAERKAAHPFSPELVDELLARIVAGRSLTEMCDAPDMPHSSTVTRWLGERPDFAAAYAAAREMQADRLFDLVWTMAREADDLARTRLKIDVVKWRVGKIAPRRYGSVKQMEAEAKRGRPEEPQTVDLSQADVWIKDWMPSPDGKHAIPVPSVQRRRPTPPGERPQMWYPGAPGPEPVRPGDEAFFESLGGVWPEGTPRG